MSQGHNVRFRPSARRDLLAVHDFIASASGPGVARGYLDRIEQACNALADFPERGTLRPDLGPGLRLLGFERRATIIFRIWKDEVQIVRVLYGGRDIEAVLRAP